MDADEATFRGAALRIMRSGPPSDGDDLLGMEIDFEAFLAALPELEPDSFDVNRTSHPETLIRATCQAAHGVSVATAAEAIRRVWLRHLRYAHSEAHHVAVGRDHATLRFVTQIDRGSLYVTAVVTVTAAGA